MTDVDWLFDNLRWDVQDDLERLVGAAPAREVARLGRGIAVGLRSAAQRFGTVAGRSSRAGASAVRPDGSDAPAEPLRR